MLASLNFIRSSLHNNQARIYRRETFLREAIMRVDGQVCCSCGKGIPAGARFANTTNFMRLCRDCYGEMPEAQALVSVRFETIRCVRVLRSLYRGVCLYDFAEAAVAFRQKDGRELRFTNLEAAQAWVDRVCEHEQLTA